MSTAKKIGAYLFLAVGVLITLFPFYFMFTSATNSNQEILRNPPSIMWGDNLVNNFNHLNERIDVLRVTGNSLFVAIAFTAISVLIFSMAGYALAKYNFKGKKLLFGFIMVSMMLPSQVLYVPLFKLMNLWGWADSYQALLLPPLANAFGIFLVRQNVLAFPNGLMEAARIDGLSEIGIFFKIVIPNIKATLSALGIYMFLSSWNNFMWPLIILGEKKMYTLPVALQFLDGIPNKKDYGMMMLAASISVLPIMIIYLFLQKHFMIGVTGGGIKE